MTDDRPHSPLLVVFLIVYLATSGTWFLAQSALAASTREKRIQTEALGLSAEEVEQMITVPMEQDLLAGVAWLQRRMPHVQGREERVNEEPPS